MVDSFVIRVCGVRWRIDCSDLSAQHAQVAAHLQHLWARAAVEPTGTEHDFTVTVGAGSIPRDSNNVPLGCQFVDPQSFPYAFSRALTLACVSVRRGEALMLHAACLAAQTHHGAAALILVGHSGAGKSTAVQQLGTTHGYITDEMTVIEKDMTISPYPKPVSLTSARPHDKDEVSPDDLGLIEASNPVTAGPVIALNRSSSAAPASIDRLDLIDGLLTVLPQTSSIQVLPDPLLRLATAITRYGGPYQLNYRNIADCTTLLGDLQHVDAVTTTRSFVHHPAIDARSDNDLTQEAVRRSAWTDAVEYDGEVLLLDGTRPVRLSGIGATLWLRAITAQTTDELWRAAVEEHGDHPHSRELVESTVSALVRGGVFQRI